MPRRRATKATSRAKPKLPDDGDNSAAMSEAEKILKREALLRDFDVEVESRITRMEKEEKWLCRSIQKATTMLLFKMPQHIKKMTVAEFHAKGGTFKQQALADLSEQVESLAQGITKSSEGGSGGDVPSSTGEVPMSESESEDTEGRGEATVASTNKGKRKGRAKKTSATPAAPAAPRTSRRRPAKKANQDPTDENDAPQTRRSARASTRSRRGTTAKGQFETPAANKGMTGLVQAGLNTPMVTPKFDPRLPVTPACLREAKRGETIMSMSGSPLSNPSKLDCNMPGILTLGNGKILDVNTSDDDSMDNLAMDETTRRNIQMLQGHLTRLLQQPQKT